MGATKLTHAQIERFFFTVTQRNRIWGFVVRNTPNEQPSEQMVDAPTAGNKTLIAKIPNASNYSQFENIVRSILT